MSKMRERLLAVMLGAPFLSACSTDKLGLKDWKLVTGLPGGYASVAPSTAAVKTDASITAILTETLEAKEKFKVELSGAEGTPLGELLVLGSPVGYSLRNRYLNVGVPLSDALARNDDPVFRDKLVSLARWDSNPETRAAALVAVARQGRDGDLSVFNEALVHLNPAVRFGALEALQAWGKPEKAAPVLLEISEKDYEPILRVYAAAGLARLGDARGLAKLRAFLDHPSWLVRAMAARWLGEHGRGEDYETIVLRMGRELPNDFTMAEHCIAALKLFPKRPAPAAPKPVAPKPLPPPPPGSDFALTLEPLVITAPRLRLTSIGIDPQVNAHLLRLLRQRQDARPDAAALLDSSLQSLGKLTTIAGYNLKTRYTELGFLLTEGLAGVTDFELAQELEKVVRLGTNVQTRAAAMVALAYTRDLRYLGLFQSVLNDPNITVRFGAVEALLTLGDPAVQFVVGNVARTDASPLLQIYAAAGIWRMGDIFGREILLRHYQSRDWFLRAMAIRWLGDLGGGDEYRRLFLLLNNETHPMARTELAAALLRLQKFAE